MDTEIMLGGLTRAGWEVTGEPAAADLLLVNTCGFIEPACKEAVETILDLAHLKKDRPEVRLVVAGCLVQRYGPELIQDLPEVDLFIGVNDFPALPELLARPPEEGAAPLVHLAPPYAYAGVEARYPATPRHLAYLKIAEGCG
ncbi:MAG: 30S ribosomal protein S12 methylthiotransferase RimO, partial [Deltaproteobacteria bacterium]|nr:30S ribosomal protein S12 methylthiotransferase RimO [Deltaproteobacteria bacterium]